MFSAAIDNRHLQAQLFENPALWLEVTAWVETLHQSIWRSQIETGFGEMILIGLLPKPNQFLGDGSQLLVEVTEAAVAAQADDGLHRPLNL